MDLRIPERDRICIYCGRNVTGEGRGEHIVQNAIGGALTLREVAGKSVCQTCNNGVLSTLDNELCIVLSYRLLHLRKSRRAFGKFGT